MCGYPLENTLQLELNLFFASTQMSVEVRHQRCHPGVREPTTSINSIFQEGDISLSPPPGGVGSCHHAQIGFYRAFTSFICPSTSFCNLTFDYKEARNRRSSRWFNQEKNILSLRERTSVYSLQRCSGLQRPSAAFLPNRNRDSLYSLDVRQLVRIYFDQSV